MESNRVLTRGAIAGCLLAGSLLLPQMGMAEGRCVQTKRDASVSGSPVAESQQSGSIFIGPTPANCDVPIGRVIAAEGARVAHGGGQPQSLPKHATICRNSSVRVPGAGRVVIELIDSSTAQADGSRPVITLGAHSSLRFKQPQDTNWVLDLVDGWLRFVSPRPTNIDVDTPYITAGVRGTEFVLHSQNDQCVETGDKQGCAVLWVREGEVEACNDKGNLVVDGDDLGQVRSVVAFKGQAPERRVLKIEPDDAVNWSIYYPPLARLHTEPCASVVNNAGQASPRESILCGTPDVFDNAVANLAATSGKNTDEHAELLSLASVIALKQNRKTEALTLAESALKIAPKSPNPYLAKSYALQATFDLEAAQEWVDKAAAIDGDDPLIKARQAEIALSNDDSAAALRYAEEAVELALNRPGADAISCSSDFLSPANGRNPVLARAWSVLGFVQLVRMDTGPASDSLQRAICADDLDPLPHLGYGLAQIREGDLDAGVRELETAVALDPRVSLYRSYLGKGYFEQDRYDLAEKELTLAKQFDDRDPTPWLYEAYVARALNNPVGALSAIEESKARNDQRAVYRSSLLLDADNAVRATSLGQDYHVLGFERLAHLAATQSLQRDPGNHSAHRLLADANAKQPRSEIGQVSNLLQARMRAPRAQHPVSARIAETRLGGVVSGGVPTPATNEYSELFERDGMSVTASALIGSEYTFEEELLFSWTAGPLSAAITQYHFETDGFRPKHYQDQQYWNAFGHYRLSPQTSVQLEYRNLSWDHGDLDWFFDSDNHSLMDIAENEDSIRVGIHHVFTPTWDNATFFRADDFEFQIIDDGMPMGPISDWRAGLSGKQAETQFIGRFDTSSLVFGVGSYDQERDDDIGFRRFLPFRILWDYSTDHRHAYAYFTQQLPSGGQDSATVRGPGSSITIGASYDDFETNLKFRTSHPTSGISPIRAESTLRRNRILPKLGMILQMPSIAGELTTARAAYFQTIKRPLLGNETLEPTSIAGFDQFFDDTDGTFTETAAVALDTEFTPRFHGGMEFAYRDMEIATIDGFTGQIIEGGAKEKSARLFLYYAPNEDWSVATTFRRLVQDRGIAAISPIMVLDAETNILTTKISYFALPRTTLSITPTWLDQDGTFFDPFKNMTYPGSEDTWLLDLSASYKIPQHDLEISLRVQNVLDERFQFQDEAHNQPRFRPERTVALGVTFRF